MWFLGSFRDRTKQQNDYHSPHICYSGLCLQTKQFKKVNKEMECSPLPALPAVKKYRRISLIETTTQSNLMQDKYEAWSLMGSNGPGHVNNLSRSSVPPKRVGGGLPRRSKCNPPIRFIGTVESNLWPVAQAKHEPIYPHKEAQLWALIAKARGWRGDVVLIHTYVMPVCFH